MKVLRGQFWVSEKRSEREIDSTLRFENLTTALNYFIFWIKQGYVINFFCLFLYSNAYPYAHYTINQIGTIFKSYSCRNFSLSSPLKCFFALFTFIAVLIVDTMVLSRVFFRLRTPSLSLKVGKSQKVFSSWTLFKKKKWTRSQSLNCFHHW